MFHRAAKIIPGWKKLPVEKQGACMEWLLASDSCWTPKHVVHISYTEARAKLPIFLEFNFEEKEEAEQCSTWWKELGNSFMVHLHSKGD
jgi:hypothetical protein